MTQRMPEISRLSSPMNRRRFVGASALAAASLGALRVPLVGAQDAVIGARRAAQPNPNIDVVGVHLRVFVQ